MMGLPYGEEIMIMISVNYEELLKFEELLLSPYQYSELYYITHCTVAHFVWSPYRLWRQCMVHKVCHRVW